MSKDLRTLLCTAAIVMAAFPVTHAAAQDKKEAPGYGSGSSSDSGSYSASANERIARVQGQNTSLVKKAEPEETQKPAVRTHEVAAGDTLWDLSASYMNDPYMWPALWSYNPQVTNPHWIYPGDTIYLDPKTAELTTAPEIPIEKPAFKRTSAAGKGKVTVPGIYIAELPETRGHILFSDQQKHMLAPQDEVQVDWVDIEMRKKVHKGQKFTVFAESKPVENEDGDPMAYKLIRLGTIELIDPHTDTLSTARIIQESREISRGDLIIPNEDLIYTVTRTSNQNDLEGRIIDTMDPLTQIGSEQYVIINRGSQDGVAVGNAFTVFEQREGLNRLPVYDPEDDDELQEERKKSGKEKDLRDGEISRDDEHYWVLGRETRAPEYPEKEDIDEAYGDRDYTTKDLPLRKIGDVLVIDVCDQFCTGIITNSLTEIGLDSPVVMLRGR